jgi:hypothetical protein
MDDKIKSLVKKTIIDDELTPAKTLTDNNSDVFESLIDMVECKREEKEYEWMSDIFIPEFASVMLSDASDWANQYFTTRDFVEAKLDNEDPKDKRKAKAAAKTINSTLNVREVYHYHKYIRARHINSIVGNVYILCWWDKEIKEDVVGYVNAEEPTGFDVEGNPMQSDTQIPAYRVVKQPQTNKTIIKDHFNYDVLDPRNVFVDNKYTYSLRDKDWVILRSERTISDLIKDQYTHGYFGLEEVDKLFSDGETETARETYNQNEDYQFDYSVNLNRYVDIYERFGKYPVIVLSRDENGNPIDVKPAFDDFGKMDYKNAEIIECIITFASNNGKYTLIRFQPTPFIDAYGKPYKPIIRGWCYIHPTKDSGLSDGKYMRELQIALNDTFNMSNDRTKLATIPTLRGKRSSVQDNDTLYIAPGNIMELESAEDIAELQIQDDVTGAINQIGMLRDYIHQVTARFPTVMGELPQHSSTSATAINETGQRANTRANYKSLTIEYTFLIDLYWMILQMANQFMERETAEKILGEYVEDFDANADYTYSPISSSIEQEYTKYRKLQLIDQFIARLSKIPNPNIIKTINYLLVEAFELFGNEFPEFRDYLLDESAPPPTDDGQFVGNANAPSSNQSGLPMSGMEAETRNGVNSGAI